MSAQSVNAAARRAEPPAARRHELDWLRALIVVGLIPFHTAVIFNVTTAMFIKDAHRSYAMDAAGAFTLAWGMPLLFVVSGAGVRFALTHRPPGRFVGERVVRLLVPFAFATVAIIPIQVYIILLSNPRLLATVPGVAVPPQALDSYLHFYPHYLAAYLAFFGHYSVTMAMVFFGHLWFIPRLFIFSLLCLPLFLFLRSPRGERLIARFGRLCRRPGAIYLLGVPLGVSEVLLRSGRLDALTRGWPVYDVWAEFAMYLVYFAIGYVVYSDAALVSAVRRHTWASLALGAAAFAAQMALSAAHIQPAASWSLAYVAAMFLRAYTWFFWVLGVLGLAIRLFARDSALLRYLSEATLPLYVLHLPILALVGFYVVRWDAGILPKFAVIATATLALTLAFYELCIRRVPPLRVLFGMKARATSTKPVPPARPGDLASPAGARPPHPPQTAGAEEREVVSNL